MKALEIISRNSLEKYPTTLDDDLRKLESQDLAQNERNVLSLIISEKKVMTSMIEATKYVTDLLLEDKSKAIEKLKNEELPENLEEYLQVEILALLVKIFQFYV